MEDENLEQNSQQNEQSNNEQQNVSNSSNYTQSDVEVKTAFLPSLINWCKNHSKLVLIAIAVIIIAFILFSIFSNIFAGPEKAVKNYISALSKLNVDKMISATDIKGTIAYSKCYSYSSGFDASKFKGEYKNVNKDSVSDRKTVLENSLNITKSAVEGRSFSAKVVRIQEVKEFENCKGLYTVEAKIRVRFKDEDGDKQDTSNTMKFIVYKNKVVSADISSLLD